MELLLGGELYGPGADMWSVGCIFAELLLRNPLFGGTDDLNQVNLIVSCMGAPTEENWPGFKALRKSFTFKPVILALTTQLFSLSERVRCSV